MSAERKIREIFCRSAVCSARVSIVDIVSRELGRYAWAPSDKAMNGRKDQSFSTAGSDPSSTPNQLSISGPLVHVSLYERSPWAVHLPRVMKAHHADDGREAAVLCHCGASKQYTQARRQIEIVKVSIISYMRHT